jgi:hypothetical protein
LPVDFIHMNPLRDLYDVTHFCSFCVLLWGVSKSGRVFHARAGKVVN